MSSITTSSAGHGIARRFGVRAVVLIAALAVAGALVVALLLARVPQNPAGAPPAPQPVTSLDQGCVQMRGPC